MQFKTNKKKKHASLDLIACRSDSSWWFNLAHYTVCSYYIVQENWLKKCLFRKGKSQYVVLPHLLNQYFLS